MKNSILQFTRQYVQEAKQYIQRLQELEEQEAISKYKKTRKMLEPKEYLDIINNISAGEKIQKLQADQERTRKLWKQNYKNIEILAIV